MNGTPSVTRSPNKRDLESDAWKDRSQLWQRRSQRLVSPRGKRERQRQSLVLTGHGVSLRIEGGALTIRNGLTHYPQKAETYRFFKGELAIPERIIMLDGSGSISFDVLSWLGADDDFTVSYGLSADDRKRMFDVIRSVSKRQLARAAHVSTRKIPASLAAANELSDKDLRRIFAEASGLVEKQRKTRGSDESMVRWLAQQVRERGAKAMAELVGYTRPISRRSSTGNGDPRASYASGLANR
jgi:hypothetical protein